MTATLAKTVRGVIVAGWCILALLGASVPGVAATITIQMTDKNTFDPVTQPVKVGDTVIWNNGSGAVHTVTPDPGQPGAFADSGDVASPGNYTITISGVPRTIKYYCKKHGAPGGGGMSGTLVVGP